MNNTEFRAQVAAEIVRNDDRLLRSRRVIDASKQGRNAREAMVMVRIALENEAGLR